ncbi:phage tail protein, partial [Reichenbachiella versicolor]|uniref:phage tail protein n=1 Tax=Reichenbachiella versicolor TaxID=1821036 RepID=UPI001C87AF58
DINEKLDKLQQQTVAKEKALKEKMAKLRAQAIAAVDKKIEERKAKMKGAMSKFGGLVLDLAMKFFTFTLTAAGMDPAPVIAMINKGVATLTEVITKPMRFFTNLGSAVNNGITGFQTNFKKHIMGGMVQWLTGAVGGIIEIPQTFDLKGIMKMGFSALGLTWMNLRQRIVKHVGEPVMGAAEKGFEVVTMIKKDGVSGLWEHLQAEAESVKQMAIDSIKNWALMTIVKEAVIKIALMLNPAGAIVEAIKSIYKLVMWIVDNTQRIITFITSVVNSVSSIAAGKISAAAGFIENAMATTIPMILSGLASFLGLGGIAKKIKEIISKVSAPINKAIDRGVGFVAKKAKAWFGKSRGGKKKVSKKQVDKQAKKEEKSSKALEEKKKKVDANKIKEENKKSGKPDKITAKDRAKHRSIVAKIKKALSIPLSKDITTYEAFHKKKKQEAEKLENKYQPQLKKGINLDIKTSDVSAGKKNSVVDFEIKIAPNTIKETHEVDFVFVDLPTQGTVYLVQYTTPYHYKVILSTGRTIDLITNNGKVEIRFEKIYEKAKIEKTRFLFQEQFKFIEVEVNETAVRNLTETKLERIAEVYAEKIYDLGAKEGKVDCFSFAMDLLKGKLNAVLTPEGNDNEEKFKSLLSGDKVPGEYVKGIYGEVMDYDSMPKNMS